MNELWKLTATQAARLIHGGKLNPIDLTEACLARITDRESQVRAFATLNPEYARGATRWKNSGRWGRFSLQRPVGNDLERDRLRLTSTSGVNHPLKQRLRP